MARQDANYKWTSLEYKNPTIRVVGPAAIVRFNFVGEQEFTDGKKVPQNLAHPDELAEAGQRLEAVVAGGHQALIASRPTVAGGQAASGIPLASRRAARSASRALRKICPSSRLKRCEAAKNLIAAGGAHDDARRLRADFDNVGVRHGPSLKISFRAYNGLHGQLFRRPPLRRMPDLCQSWSRNSERIVQMAGELT